MIERPSHLEDTDVAIFEKDGEIWAMDQYGEFGLDPPYGNSEKQDGLCNAPLRHSMDRYGEIRYCSQTPYWTADHQERDDSEWCKTHLYMEQAMENVKELLKHGYFGTNYALFEQTLDPYEFLSCVDMFAGLLEQSKYDFDTKMLRRAIDSSTDPFIEEDSVVIDIPLPQAGDYQTQAQELWFFVLDQIVEQRMQNIRLDQGVSTSHVVDTADVDGVITDRIEEGAEHHLNLPISRLSKDKKERLKIGGVEVGADEDAGSVVFSAGDYVLDVSADEDDGVKELDTPIAEQIEPEDD